MGLLGHVVLYLSRLRNCHAFPKCLHHLHSHWQCMEIPVSPHPHQHLTLSVFLAILLGLKQYLVVLICVSLMTNHVEHLFVCLLAFGMSLLEKWLFNMLPIFNEFVFLLLSSKCYLNKFHY